MAGMKKVPAIRFKGFSDFWAERNFLANIEKIIDFRGRTPKKLGLDWSESGYLALSALNVKSGYIDFNLDAHYGNQDLYDKWMLGNELHKSQVLFTTEAPMGNVAQIPDDEKYILSQRTIAFKVKPSLLAEDFLAIVLGSPKTFKKLTSMSTGGTAKGVSQKSLAALDLTIPSDTTEQTQIGSYFQHLDKLISLHQTKINKLTNLKKAMLEKMFSKQGANVPEIRFKGFSGAWKIQSLGDIADFSRGKALSWSDIDSNGSFECVLYGHLYTDYGMVINEVKYFTNSPASELVKSKCGDVLIPCSDTTPTGLARATSIEKSGVFLGGDINILRPKSGLIGSFLSYNINANRNKLIKLIKGTTVRHLDNTDLKTVELYIPANEKEQIKISEYFQSLDKTITLHQTELEKLNNLKKACLEKMFI